MGKSRPDYAQQEEGSCRQEAANFPSREPGGRDDNDNRVVRPGPRSPRGGLAEWSGDRQKIVDRNRTLTARFAPKVRVMASPYRTLSDRCFHMPDREV